jgi:hypothetical protein
LKRIKDGTCLGGYWQSEEYFKHIRGEILKRFVPGRIPTARTTQLLDKIEDLGNRSVFVTVRRTDYVGNKYLALLPINYYWEACRKLNERISNPFFLVFSDDPEWCRKNFHLPYPYRFEVVGENDMTTYAHLGKEDMDLWAMSKCHNAIMANSSFSWWGAWLSQVQDEKRAVIAPKQWFLSGAKYIVPDRWIRV